MALLHRAHGEEKQRRQGSGCAAPGCSRPSEEGCGHGTEEVQRGAGVALVWAEARRSPGAGSVRVCGAAGEGRMGRWGSMEKWLRASEREEWRREGSRRGSREMDDWIRRRGFQWHKGRDEGDSESGEGNRARSGRPRVRNGGLRRGIWPGRPALLGGPSGQRRLGSLLPPSSLKKSYFL